jgi:hypothetical protein
MPREDMVRSKYHQIVTEESYFRPDCAQLSSQCVSEKGGRKIIEEGFKESAKTAVPPMGANQLLVENTCVTSNVRGAKNGGRIRSRCAEGGPDLEDKPSTDPDSNPTTAHGLLLGRGRSYLFACASRRNSAFRASSDVKSSVSLPQ